MINYNLTWHAISWTTLTSLSDGKHRDFFGLHKSDGLRLRVSGLIEIPRFPAISGSLAAICNANVVTLTGTNGIEIILPVQPRA
jgi:hypothetical protein